MARRDEIVRMVARLAGKHWGVPPERVEALEHNVIAAVNGELSRMYGGESLKITTCKVTHEIRAARNARILAALERGEPVAEVAQRERVSHQLVRWLRAKARA